MKSFLIAVAHYLIIVIFFSSPFWISWYWIIAGAVGYYLVVNVWLGYCPLTKWQYGDTSEGFIEKNLKAFFRLFNYSPDQKRLKWFITYGIPVTIISTAVIWQSLT